MRSGGVIWITGLSAAGKTTLASKLVTRLPGNSLLLDGDALRGALKSLELGYKWEERRKLAFAYARLAQMLAKQRQIVVVATVALFHEVHAWNRTQQPCYYEVFLDVPEEIRRGRDKKGVYSREMKKNSNIAGIDVPVEFPKTPDLHVKYEDN